MDVQLYTIDKRKGRRFTPQQKLQILKEWELTGNGAEVAEKHRIHPQTLYRWRKALEQGAQTFLSGKRRRVDPRIKELEEEGPICTNCFSNHIRGNLNYGMLERLRKRELCWN